MLTGDLVLLEPLLAQDHDALQEAAAAGQLWNLSYTHVPRPEQNALCDSGLSCQASRGHVGALHGSTPQHRSHYRHDHLLRHRPGQPPPRGTGPRPRHGARRGRGGGLVGGISSWYAGRVGVVAVEPERAPTLHAALAAGEPVDVEVGGVAADSLGARRIGDHGLAAVLRARVGSVLVTHAAILGARRRLWQDLPLVTETGGATALAALTSGAYVPQDGERVGVVLCGGNTDPVDLSPSRPADKE
jgi:hypothetical protein